MLQKENENGQDRNPTSIPKLEVRIPISPREQDMRMVRYFLESLQEFGGPIGRQARCVLSVGADEEPRDLKKEYPWTADHEIDIHWVDREQFRRWTYDATGFDRLQIESNADVVALVDADLLIAGDFDRAVLESHQDQRCLGVIAHVSPFGWRRWPSYSPRWRWLRLMVRAMPFGLLTHSPSDHWWNLIFDEVGLPRPSLDWQHTGWGLQWQKTKNYRFASISRSPKHRYCPAYFNYGFIIAPRVVVEGMGETFVADLQAVARVVDTGFASQIANTIGLARQAVSCGALPINYNFPLNIPGDEFRSLNPDPQGEDSHEDIKVFHYIRGRKHFASKQSVEELLNCRGLDGAWPVFQRKLRKVHEKLFPVATV